MGGTQSPLAILSQRYIQAIVDNFTGRVENSLKSLSKSVCITGGWFLILISIMICIEVLMRKVFNHSLQGVDEYGGYALALTAALGLAYAFYEGTHIKIDVLVRLLPRHFRIGSSLLAQVTLFSIAAFFAYRTVLHAFESWELMAFANTPLRTPLYIPQGIWAAGFCLFMLVLAVRLLVIFEMVIRRQKTDLLALLDTNHEELKIKSAIAEAAKSEKCDGKII